MAEVVPIRPCEGGLRGAIRAADEAGEAVAAARTRLLHAHARRLLIPSARDVREVVGSGVAGAIAVLAVLTVRVAASSTRPTEAVGALIVVPSGVRGVSTGMRGG